MEMVQALGGSSFLLVSTVLSFRLFALAKRNRALPELLLGISFLFGGTIGAVIEATAQAFPPERAGALLAVAKIFGLVGMTTNLVFTWWVFRRRDAWAPWLIAAVVAILLSGFVGHALAGTFRTGVPQPGPFWIELLGRLAVPCWLSVEAFLYWQRMRRRAQVGLADPVVTNRFLLWTVASTTSICFLMTSVPPLYLEAGTPLLNADLVAFGLFGIGTALAYWLAFFPPAAYLRRLERAARAAA